jgi:hypothetical protein
MLLDDTSTSRVVFLAWSPCNILLAMWTANNPGLVSLQDRCPLFRGLVEVCNGLGQPFLRVPLPNRDLLSSNAFHISPLNLTLHPTVQLRRARAGDSSNPQETLTNGPTAKSLSVSTGCAMAKDLGELISGHWHFVLCPLRFRHRPLLCGTQWEQPRDPGLSPHPPFIVSTTVGAWGKSLGPILVRAVPWSSRATA